MKWFLSYLWINVGNINSERYKEIRECHVRSDEEVKAANEEWFDTEGEPRDF